MDITKVINKYESHSFHGCLDFYKEPEGEWNKCPKCGLKPKAWQFDNGRFTACGCWNSEYDHFSVRAESVMSVYKRTNGKKMNEYDSDGLRKNWNHYCETGDILFSAENGLW